MADNITITIYTGNDAFRESPTLEIARVLRELADKFEDGVPPEFTRDANGQRVGQVKIETA